MSDKTENGPEPRNPRQPPPGYKVGPRNPPYERRWVKGEPSPNPRGRPPKKHLKGFFAELDPLAAALIEFDQKGTGVIGADGNEHTKATAFFTSVHHQSASNPRYAELYDKMRSDAYAQRKKLNAEAYEAAIYHRWRYLDEFLEAERSGRPPPDILPDPRDLIIGPDGELKIVGPMDREQLHAVNQAIKERDFAMDGLKMIEEMEALPEAKIEARNYLTRRIYRLNKCIPPRLRKRIPRQGRACA